jgi:hypothetical protein
MKYHCEYCDYNATSKKLWNAHIKSKQHLSHVNNCDDDDDKDSDSNSDSNNNSNNSNNNTVCKMCEKDFSTINGLATHCAFGCSAFCEVIEQLNEYDKQCDILKATCDGYKKIVELLEQQNDLLLQDKIFYQDLIKGTTGSTYHNCNTTSFYVIDEDDDSNDDEESNENNDNEENCSNDDKNLQIKLKKMKKDCHIKNRKKMNKKDGYISDD